METLCIYCMRKTADTVDHVPSKLLLRTPYPPNLWTVPACSACNRAFSRDEEYFRMIILGLFCFSDEAEGLFDGPIRRSFDRRPALMGKTFGSLAVDGEQTYVVTEQDRLLRVIVKNIVGLHYLEFGFRPDLFSRYEIQFFHNEEPSIPDAVVQAAFNAKFDPDFRFRYVVTGIQACQSVWQITHFGDVHWLVTVSTLHPPGGM